MAAGDPIDIDDEGPGLPSWIRSSFVVWAGAFLGVVAIALTVGWLWLEKRSLEHEERASVEMFARVLQESADRTFDTVDLTLVSLAEHAADYQVAGGLDLLSTTLTHNIAGLPFLRSLSVVDRQGLILRSTERGNVGMQLDPGRIALHEDRRGAVLGSIQAGRDLANAAIDGPPSPPGRTFLPLVRAAGQLFVVAVLNPEFFSNQQDLTLAGAGRDAALLSTDGTMLSGTSGLRLVPGEAVPMHPFFTTFFPARESGSFIGPGIDGPKVVTAFRVLRKLPVLVVVESRYDRVEAALGSAAFGAASGCGVVLVFIVAMTAMAWRSLRGHESVRRALGATRQNVAESERNLRTLVESVHELIFRADAEGRIGFVNGRWQEIYGAPSAGLIGLRLSAVCVAGDRDVCDALFVLGRERAETTLIRVDSAAGRALTLEISVADLHDAHGTATGFAGFAVDVTEREQARRSLEAQLAFTAQLLEVSPVALFVKDVDGRFETVNRAWLELMDLTPAQVIGRTSADLYGPEGPKHIDQDARLLQTGQHVRYENRLVLAGRAPKDTIVAKVRFTGADGVPAGIVGSIIDVTEFRNAERETARARDAAELANRAESQFLANITHELRTPLQGIIGFSEIGAEIAAGSPDFHEMFKDIHLGGQRMLTLVNGLLDVALMESAIGSLTLEPRDLGDALREVLVDIGSKATQKGQSIVTTGFDAPVPARIDVARWQQAIRAVLVNSIEYGPRGGVVHVDGREEGGDLVVEVRDAGPGIPADELERVFEAFVQSSRTADGSGGVGLGLTIARKIVGAHGGRIVASNGANGGTVVRLTLPRVEKAGAEADRADAALSHGVER